MDIKEIEKKLKAPFPAKDIEWRVQSAGSTNDRPWAKVLAYIDGRAIMDRLDEVVGPENWTHEIRTVQCGDTHGFVCRLRVNLDDQVVFHEDVCDISDIEPLKGAVSGALKRAAVHFGIGRYLYNLTEGWAVISDTGSHYQGGKEGKYKAFKWDPPQLPDWALPAGEAVEKSKAAPKATKKPPVEAGKAPIAPEAGQTTPQAPTDLAGQSTTAGGSPLLKKEVVEGIIKAFGTYKKVLGDLEKHVALTSDRWTEIQRANLLAWYTELKTKT